MSKLLGGKLDNQEIHKKLTEYEFPSGYNPSEKLIGSIIEQFWFHDFYNSFLSDPVLLDFLIQYLDENHQNKFNRYDFYTFLFNKIVNNSNSRKLLQQFSLMYEKLQTNSVLISEMNNMTDLSALSSEVSPILWLENKHLINIKDEDGNKYLVWNHHTFTEFLVAEYLLEKKNLIEEFRKMAILEQEGIVAFKPSWSGVLRFLMESKKGNEIAAWLIQYLEKNKDNIDDNLSEILVFTGNNITNLNLKNVFNLIYNFYYDRKVWLPLWTRRRLSKFVDRKIYQRLKQNIKKWPDQTETYVKRGNVVTIIEGLLETESKLMTKKERTFWRKTFINFTNKPDDGGNGVLQRDSLSALAYYKDEKIIPEVSENCFENTQDTLVKDEFIQFCYNSAPNSKYAINYFIKGIKTGSGIYARHGLYNITDKKAIEYFLSSISVDDQFLRSFLRRESIFDKEDGDEQLIKNIKKYSEKKLVLILKKIIFRIFLIGDLYQEEKSNFIKQIVLIINNEDPNFLFEILDEIKNKENETKSLHLFFDYQETLAILLTPENLETYFNKAKDISDRRIDSAIYIAKRINGEIGQSVYEKAVNLKLVKPVDEEAANLYWEKQEKERKQKRIDEFLRLLEPTPGKFFPGVFEYYKQNQKEFDEYFKTKKGLKAKNRLIKLAVDEGIKKIDPSKFKVTISNKEESNHHFTWTAAASYFGDVLSIVKIFAPDEIKKHKRQIIDFIPFAFSDDMSQIMDLIPDINDKDFEFVDKVLSDPKDDRRYLIPGTYIYLVEHYAKKGYKLSSAKKILTSFIYDKYVPDYEQRASLEKLIYFIDNNDKEMESFLKDIFDKKGIDDHHRHLGQIANSLLISTYKNEGSINWRFQELRRPVAFKGRRMDGEVHEVGPIEEEFDSMTMAKPLIELRDEKYLSKFLELLSFSFEVMLSKKTDQENKEYWEYSTYLWRICIAFIENLKEKGSFRPLLELKNWVASQTNVKNLNWLTIKIKELERNYISYVRPYDKMIFGVEELSKINSPIAQIAYFLFKAQAVEFQLKKLVEGMNYQLEKANSKLPIYRKLNRKSLKRIEELTLGQLINELNNFTGKSIDKLKQKLNDTKFNEKRIDFTHRLFLQNRKTDEVIRESKVFSEHSDDILKTIQEVWIEVLTIK